MKTGIKQMLSNVGNLNRLLSNPTSTELDQTALTSKTFQRKGLRPTPGQETPVLSAEDLSE